MEHYGRHLEFHSPLVCGEAAHTKSEKLDSFGDSGSNNFKQVHSSCMQCCEVAGRVLSHGTLWKALGISFTFSVR